MARPAAQVVERGLAQLQGAAREVKHVVHKLRPCIPHATSKRWPQHHELALTGDFNRAMAHGSESVHQLGHAKPTKYTKGNRRRSQGERGFAWHACVTRSYLEGKAQVAAVLPCQLRDLVLLPAQDGDRLGAVGHEAGRLVEGLVYIVLQAQQVLLRARQLCRTASCLATPA